VELRLVKGVVVAEWVGGSHLVRWLRWVAEKRKTTSGWWWSVCWYERGCRWGEMLLDFCLFWLQFGRERSRNGFLVLCRFSLTVKVNGRWTVQSHALHQHNGQTLHVELETKAFIGRTCNLLHERLLVAHVVHAQQVIVHVPDPWPIFLTLLV